MASGNLNRWYSEKIFLRGAIVTGKSRGRKWVLKVDMISSRLSRRENARGIKSILQLPAFDARAHINHWQLTLESFRVQLIVQVRAVEERVGVDVIGALWSVHDDMAKRLDECYVVEVEGGLLEDDFERVPALGPCWSLCKIARSASCIYQC